MEGIQDWNNYIAKRINEISYLYPACEEDAFIIYEEWAKGILSECRPSEEMLRAYAKYTADPIQFKIWAKMILKNR